jgi:hypothetical protein
MKAKTKGFSGTQFSILSKARSCDKKSYTFLKNMFSSLNSDKRHGRVLDLKGNVLDEGYEKKHSKE